MKDPIDACPRIRNPISNFQSLASIPILKAKLNPKAQSPCVATIHPTAPSRDPFNKPHDHSRRYSLTILHS